MTVITGTSNDRQVRKKLSRSRDCDHLEVIWIYDGYKQKKSAIFRLLAYVRFALRSTFEVLAIPEVDIVFASSTPLTTGLSALVAHRFRRKRYVFEVRDLWPDAPIALGYLKNPALQWIARVFEIEIYKHAQAVIALSEGIARKIQTRTSTKTVFIPNSVDSSFLEKAKKTIDQKDSVSLRVVYAGSCGYNNAIDTLASVILQVKTDPEMLETVEFTIVGDGPALNRYRHELRQSCRLVGRIPKNEVIEYLFHSDVGIYPQRRLFNNDLKRDSLPNKFFDYMGAGLAILASVESEGEVAHTIRKHDMGLISEPENVSQIVQQLRVLHRNRKLVERLKANARKARLGYLRASHATFFRTVLEDAISNGPS